MSLWREAPSQRCADCGVARCSTYTCGACDLQAAVAAGGCRQCGGTVGPAGCRSCAADAADMDADDRAFAHGSASARQILTHRPHRVGTEHMNHATAGGAA